MYKRFIRSLLIFEDEHFQNPKNFFCLNFFFFRGQKVFFEKLKKKNSLFQKEKIEMEKYNSAKRPKSNVHFTKGTMGSHSTFAKGMGSHRTF